MKFSSAAQSTKIAKARDATGDPGEHGSKVRWEEDVRLTSKPPFTDELCIGLGRKKSKLPAVDAFPALMSL